MLTMPIQVVDMLELPLQYRVAVALKFLDDEALGEFLSEQIQAAVYTGDTEGLVLTGLTSTAVRLFQNYILRFNDIQTALLVVSLATPHMASSDNSLWESWKVTYFDQMQAWSAFIQRAKFISQHKKMVDSHRAIGGVRLGSIPNLTEKQNMLMQCSHCKKPIANGHTSAEGDMPPLRQNPITPEGTVCRNCSQHFPRCAICLHWQGQPRSKLPSEEDDNLGFMMSLIGFCVRCKHSFHVPHAKEWFAQHLKCPVPDCSCSCNLGQGLPQR